MTMLVVDTSALFAFIRDDDRFHEAALRTFRVQVARESDFLTTSYALVEAIALTHRRRGFGEAQSLIDFVEATINVAWMDEASHSAAKEQYVASRGQSLSLVDWSVLLLARETQADLFSFDSRMSGRGVRVVPGDLEQGNQGAPR